MEDSKSGTYDSARRSARVQRAKTKKERKKHRASGSFFPPPVTLSLPLCLGLGLLRDVSRQGRTTTRSLAYSFCDGPSGAQDMPLLPADPISLTSLVNLDGRKSRLCHLSVIA